MKPIFQTNHRHRSTELAAATSRVSQKTDYNYQAATLDDVDGGRVCDCKPPFRAIGRCYFAREAHYDFVSEASVFCLLMLTTIPPLLNGASAIVALSLR
jgi:hypothetical protein